VPEADGDYDFSSDQPSKKKISGWVNSKLLARAHCPKDIAMTLMPLSASTTGSDLCVEWSRATQITEYYRTARVDISI
jgi:hypothetical protein